MPNISGRGLGLLDVFNGVKVGLSTYLLQWMLFENDKKKTSYFIYFSLLKALFVLRVFKFLLGYFRHTENAAWLER